MHRRQASGIPWPWPARVRRLLPWLLFNLLPSFVQRRLHPSLVRKSDKPLHATAFLDGIRGVASLLVYFHHLYFVSHDVKHAYGQDNKLLSSLPVVRLLICGHSIVSLFFVVSGFALSVKPLRLMQRREWKDLHVALSSSVARRALRLYLPCVASTFLIALLLQLHVYEAAGRYIANNERVLTDFREKHPVRKPTLFLELQSWIMVVVGLLNPWTNSTPALQFKTSMILFVVQLGVSRLVPAARRTFLFILIYICFDKSWWTPAFFFSGFLIADFDCNNTSPASQRLPTLILPGPNSIPLPLAQYQSLWLRHRSSFWLATFVFGLYAASAPGEHFERTIGYQILGALTPAAYKGSKMAFWNAIGAILTVWAATNSPTAKRIFTSRPAQYLGRISFAIYLVHGLTIHTLGYACLKATWGATGLRTRLARELGFYMAAAPTTLGVIWLADVFTRAVDVPSKRFARWCEEQCSVDGATAAGPLVLEPLPDLDERRRYLVKSPSEGGRELSNSSKRRYSLQR